MKKSTLLLLSLLGAFFWGCQDHNLEPHTEDVMAWRAGGSESDSGSSIVVDKAGNLYITGSFRGTATFGTTTLTATGGPDVFVAKYNRLGEVLWVHKAGGTDSEGGSDIAIDGSGNLYVIGSFIGTATFGSTTLTSSGGSDIFLAKYSNNGEEVWAQRAGGTDSEGGVSIAVDESGNAYITGSFSGAATFGTTTITSSGDSDVFIAKYNSSGEVVWAQRAGGTDSEGGSGIAVDKSGNAYITGSFRGTAVFGVTTLISSGFRESDFNGFVAKYSSTGEILWARKSNPGADIEADGNGNVYITGSVNIGPFTTDIHIAKFNTNGEIQWSKYLGNLGTNDAGADIALDESGNVYLTGFIGGSPIGVEGGGGSNLVHYGRADIFVAKFDNNANFIWAKNAGGAGNDFGRGIAVDANGTAYVTGSFEQTANFGSTTLTSAGESDIFVAKFKQ